MLRTLQRRRKHIGIILPDEHIRKQTSDGSVSVENKGEDQCKRAIKLSKEIYLLIHLVQYKRDAIKLCDIRRSQP